MDAKTFFDNFGLIASAPNGIEQLRSMILQLAVQGKLSTNIDSDTPVEKTLEYLHINKKELLDREDIRLVLGATDAPVFQKNLPKSWRSITMNSIAWPQAGFSFKSTNFNKLKQGIPLIRIRDISKKDTEVYYSGEYKDDFLVKTGDYLIAMDGNFNIARWQGSTALLNQRVTRLVFFDEGEVNRVFIFIVLQLTLQKLQGETSYTTVDHLSTKQIANITIHLPPKEEQDRIVATVERLLAILDRLEALNSKRERLQAFTNRVVVSMISNASNKNEFKKIWRILSVNFNEITKDIVDLTLLRRAIFDCGTLGYFQSATLPDPERISRNLLTEIQQRRLQWLKNTESQECKEASLIQRKLENQTLPATPHKIPSHWMWATLLQVSQAVIDCHNKTAPYINNGIHLIRTSDVRNGKLSLENTKKVDQDTYEFWSRRLPPRKGDIIFTREAPMGEAAIVPEETVCLGQRTMLIRLFDDLLNNQFLVNVIYSSSFIEQMESFATGTMVRHLRVSTVESLLVPVPPFDEQIAIVKKISKLIKLVDSIESKNQQIEKLSRKFASSAIKTLTGIEISRRESMKAPKTEIITELSIKHAPSDSTVTPLYALLQQEGGKLTAKALWQASAFDDINQFYQQLRTEIHNGWIEQGELTVYVEKTEENA